MPTNLDTELAHWLRLALAPQLTPSMTRLLLANYGLPQHIFAQSVTALSKYVPIAIASQLKQSNAELDALITQHLHWAQQPNNHIVCLADAHYPKTLLQSHDPPLLLFCKGKLALLNYPSLAIVGARNATRAGLDNAYQFAKHLSSTGWSIVSGLATGIDAAAHTGSLDAHNTMASTIAVMGTGIDLVYPAGHRDLAHRIANAGLLISEFPLGTKALAYHFPKRNRVVAGLTQGVLVVEAAVKSGSLITAKYATEQGKEVFAIPGSIHSPLARGCHLLIRQGAKLVESAAHINEELPQQQQLLQAHTLVDSPTPAAATRHTPTAAQQQLLDIIGFEGCAPETIQAHSQLDTATLAPLLVELELQGFIYQDNATGHYLRLAP